MYRTSRSVLIAAALASALSASHAEIEKFSTICNQGICFAWWPKLPTLAKWHHDRQSSLMYGFNALVPNGSSFAEAEAIIYAIAPYKPRVPDDKTLEQHIQHDLDNFLAETPDLQITETDSLVTKDGKRLRSFLFQPRTRGQWERVTYGEEGEFFISFVASARTEIGLKNAMKDYLHLVRQYSEK